MSTFFGQLAGFAVIVWLVWKYVVPPVRNMMRRQQEAVRTQLAEHAEAEKKVADADTEHAKALEEAKAEATRVIEEARHDAESIAEQLRAQADVELERIKIQGAQQFGCCASNSSASFGRASAPNPCIAQATWCAILFPIRPSSPKRWTASSPSSTRWHRRAPSSRMPSP